MKKKTRESNIVERGMKKLSNPNATLKALRKSNRK